jgi:hypothetical protein
MSGNAAVNERRARTVRRIARIAIAAGANVKLIAHRVDQRSIFVIIAFAAWRRVRLIATPAEFI